jgi:hypothetical protein
MENLFIGPTNVTPAVLFIVEKGILNISGKCLPENARNFFIEIENALNVFIADHSHNSLVITFELEYINTSASKYLYDFLNKAVDSVENVSIVWGYEEEDEDMLEQGQIFKEFFKVPFDFKIFVAD